MMSSAQGASGTSGNPLENKFRGILGTGSGSNADKVQASPNTVNNITVELSSTKKKLNMKLIMLVSFVMAFLLIRMPPDWWNLLSSKLFGVKFIKNREQEESTTRIGSKKEGKRGSNDVKRARNEDDSDADDEDEDEKRQTKSLAAAGNRIDPLTPEELEDENFQPLQ